MSQRLTCLRGHHWETPGVTEGGEGVFAAACPVCGAAVSSSAISGDPQRLSPMVPGVGATAPLAAGSGRVFWIAMLFLVFVGIVCLFVLPLIFPGLDWFGASGPLKDEKTVTVRPGEILPLRWDAPRVEKATVTVKSPGNPVSVYLVAGDETDAAIQSLKRGMPPDSSLAIKTWVENVTVEISPGKKPFTLLLQTTARKADVTVNVRGK